MKILIRFVMHLNLVLWVTYPKHPHLKSQSVQYNSFLMAESIFPPHIMNLRGDTESESNGDNPDQKSELSKRQLQVLDLITDGKSNKSIAEELGLSTGTIKMHVSGIFKKLNVTNRTEAVARYSKRKIDFDNQE